MTNQHPGSEAEAAPNPEQDRAAEASHQWDDQIRWIDAGQRPQDQRIPRRQP